MVDIVGVGESLPFKDGTFDVVVCTQVLSYVSNPHHVVSEFYRVLKSDSHLLLSAPAFFPCHHDERWRFMPEGLELLLSQFDTIEILPEGHSISGVFRITNVWLNLISDNYYIKRILSSVAFPFFNTAGLLLDKLSFGNRQLTNNYSVWAKK